MEIGLTIALAVVVGAFSYGQSEKKVTVIDMQIAPVSEEIIMHTEQKETPPEIKTQTVQVLSDFLNIVRNDTQITTDVSFKDFGVDVAIDIPVMEEEKIEETPVFIAEEMPGFKGGDLNTFRTWVQTQLRYPAVAQENGLQGKVILKFVIEKDGSLTNIEEVNSPHSSLTEEATRVLKLSPKWSPGKQRNKAVRVYYILPIDFVLSN
jgi:protein TonB